MCSEGRNGASEHRHMPYSAVRGLFACVCFYSFPGQKPDSATLFLQIPDRDRMVHLNFGGQYRELFPFPPFSGHTAGFRTREERPVRLFAEG